MKGRYIKLCQIIINMSKDNNIISEIYHCGGCGTDLNEDTLGLKNMQTIETTKGKNPGCYSLIICGCGKEITRIRVRSPFRIY
ncbi:hypothetical protein D4Q76_00220 [archaeon]|nr:MAG: hypothetical protein D4Q76_00220 [archaeon]